VTCIVQPTKSYRNQTAVGFGIPGHVTTKHNYVLCYRLLQVQNLKASPWCPDICRLPS